MRLLALSFSSCAGLLLLGAGDASAAGPAAPAKAHGAIVIALGDGATGAAKPLAREVYRDEALRAAVDEATARVLVGEAPLEGAPSSLRDLAQVRGTISSSVDDAAARRLLASIGADAHAEIVVAVSKTSDERTIARVLRVEAVRYEPVELVPSIERTDAGEVRFSWPGVASTLRTWVTPVPEAPPPLAPRKPVAPEAPKEAPKKPFYTSPWFWGPASAVVVVAAAVFIASQVTTDDPSTVHLSGTVSP